jgi:hypothetical protein
MPVPCLMRDVDYFVSPALIANETSDSRSLKERIESPRFTTPLSPHSLPFSNFLQFDA